MCPCNLEHGALAQSPFTRTRLRNDLRGFELDDAGVIALPQLGELETSLLSEAPLSDTACILRISYDLPESCELVERALAAVEQGHHVQVLVVFLRRSNTIVGQQRGRRLRVLVIGVLGQRVTCDPPSSPRQCRRPVSRA